MSSANHYGRGLLIAAVTCLSATLAADKVEAISFTEYTNRAAWEAAVGSWNEEQFGDATLNPGLSFSFIGAGHTAVGQGVGGGEFHDRVVSSPPPSSTDWIFPWLTNAFGANWDLSPGGAGLGLNIFAADGSPISINQTIPNTFTGGFWGFVADTQFASVTITASNQPAIAETYDMDNLVYATPEPGTLVLLGLGLAALRRAGRRSES